MRNKVGYVYFVSMDEGETSYMKIGFSTDPMARFSNLKTSTPFPLEIHWIFPGTTEDERHIHERLAKVRHKREWFRESDELDELIYDLLDARNLLKLKHGEDYDPSIRECLDIENVADVFNKTFQALAEHVHLPTEDEVTATP